MKRLRLCALISILLLTAFCSCGKTEEHSYPDYSQDNSAKFLIDLSDERRFSDKGELVISEAGRYRISGKAEGKQIVIAAHPKAEIILSLEGASISNKDGSVLTVNRAGSVIIAVAEGSDNYLSTGRENRGAPVISSDIPLTVDGKGALCLCAGNGTGADIGGDAFLLGSKITVISDGNAITARGSVTLGGCELNITSGSGGIYASGKVEMTDGTLFADTHADAITADEISISDGRCDLSCQAYIFNTEKDINIDGGEVLLCSYSAEKEYGIISSGAKLKHTSGQLISLSDGHAPIADQSLCSVNITLSDTAEGGIISLKNADGKEAVKSERSRLPVRHVSIAAPSIVQGEKYTVSIGEIRTKIVQSELVSQKTVSTAPASMTKHEYGGINYLLYTPAYVSEELPMLVFLHGSGEKGEDLGILTLAPSLPKFLNDGTLEIDAYVIIPQLPKTEDGWYKIAAGLENLIEHSRETLPVIKNKVALTGHSLGGGGVWMLALRHTDRYSRIAPLSGWVDLNDTNLKKLSRIPVWDLVGELDTAVPPEESKPMTDALKAIGADVRSTVFSGAKHHEVPALAYLDEKLGLMEWLLS